MKGKVNYRALLVVIQNNKELYELITDAYEMPIGLIYSMTVGGKMDEDLQSYLDWMYDKVMADETLTQEYKSIESELALKLN